MYIVALGNSILAMVDALLDCLMAAVRIPFDWLRNNDKAHKTENEVGHCNDGHQNRCGDR